MYDGFFWNKNMKNISGTITQKFYLWKCYTSTGGKSIHSTKRFHLNKKGFHPIVAAALLIVVLIGVASIVYIWISLQNKAGNAVWIPNVNFNQSDLIVYIQNIGDDSVILYSLYINQDSFLITPTNCLVANQQTTLIEKGQTAAVTINNSYQEKIQIRVVCEDGTNTQSDWRPWI